MGFMTRLIEFITNHVVLVSLFVFSATLWLGFEVRHRKAGGKKLSHHAVIEMLNHQDAALVDVRNLGEFSKGHIQGALHLPFSNLSQAPSSLQKVKEKPIILACQTGLQSPAAVTILKKQGFNSLYYLDGGMSAWVNEKLPVVN